MSFERMGPDDPRLWLDYARTDLRIAREGVKHGYRLEPLCFHAQQAAEKALKAILVSRHISFPKIHELDRLMRRLPFDLVPPPQVKKAASLSDYSESGRYPHGFEDLTLEDHRRAVESAKAVLDWAEKIIARDEDPGVQEKGTVYRVPKKIKKRMKTKKSR
jgi:HEPN domain-containing protein